MTEEDVWRPLGFDSPDEVAAYDALHEGVPPWLANSFWPWVQGFFVYSSGGSSYVKIDLLRLCERVCRFNSGHTTSRVPGFIAALQAATRGIELRLADFLIANNTDVNMRDRALRLGVLLSQAGSAYTVGQRAGKPGLVRRVPSGVQAAADAVMQQSGHAGVALAAAWEKLYGVDPDPSAAYTLAVRAVENAAIPLVVPAQAGATLGHVIGRLDNDDHWGLALTSGTGGRALVVDLCRALFSGHHDRHGGNADAQTTVSQQEAEVAVSIAVTLVQWFSAGLVGRRP